MESREEHPEERCGQQARLRQERSQRVFKIYDEINTLDRAGVNKRKMLEDGHGPVCKKSRDSN
jgi:hypothetical protein